MLKYLMEMNSFPLAREDEFDDTDDESEEDVSSVRLNFLSTNQLTDCSFEVGSEDEKEIINGHRFILSMCSPVFEATFLSNLRTIDAKQPIRVPDVKPCTFSTLLNYIYGGEDALSEIISFDDISALYCAADKYRMGTLVELCSKKLIIMTNVSTACRVYEFGKLHSHQFRAKALNVIEHNMEAILNDPSFLDVSYETLLEIFSIDSVHESLSSETVYHSALSKWFTRYCEENNKNLNDSDVEQMTVPALKQIDFFSMTMEELLIVTENTPFFTYEEKFVLLFKKMKPSCRAVLPEKVSDKPRVPSRVSRKITHLNSDGWYPVYPNNCINSLWNLGR